MPLADPGKPGTPPRLQLLIADETNERLDTITAVVEKLGHEIVARVLDVQEVGRLSRHHVPDVALVGVGLNSTHALEMIGGIVHEAACPVIALLDTTDESYVNEAAKRGVFAYVVMNGNSGELQNALDITLRRFAEFHNLEGAFGRRAIIEQAKGILMARNSIDADTAHQLLKNHSQRTGTKLSDVAQAITEAHLLLVRI
jgi:AmiR/NasT family two-component response regulator